MINSRRLRAGFLASLVFLFTVFPVKRSEAFVPPVALAVALYGPAGAVVAADAFAAGVSALIGVAIVAMAITPNNADAPVRVPLSSDKPTIDAVMPPPSGVPSTAQISDVYGFSYGCFGVDNGSFFNSYAEACSAAGGSMIYGVCRDLPSGCFVGTRTISRTPVGYGNCSGNTCSLIEPRAVAADNKYDIPIPVAGAGYVPPSSSQDVDAPPVWNNMSGGVGYASGKDLAGRPVVVEYSVSADGSKTYVRHYTQLEDAVQTTVKTQSLTIDRASGSVVSASASTAVGSIAAPTAAGSAAGVVPVVQTGAQVTTGSGTNSSPISFPSDYARSGESATAANTIKTSVDSVKDKLTDSASVSDPVIPEWADGLVSAFNPLKAWSMPGHSSQCPTGGFSWNGAVYVIDSHCQLFADYWSSLQNASIVVWTIAALFIVLAA